MTSIKRLAELYMETIACDYHKDRDRYFKVGIIYDAYEEVKYYSSHDGYINEYYEEFTSFEEAEKGLQEQLKTMLLEELDYATKVNIDPEEYDVYVLAQPRVEEIRKEVFGG